MKAVDEGSADEHGVRKRFVVYEIKFGVELAAAERAQAQAYWSHGIDHFQTESQSPVEQDSMQGWSKVK